tara:strand:+ start:523 stop:708 length:186 start_codon:yes stop_codon:yes gene_type:complete
MKAQKVFPKIKSEVDFKDIDKHLLEGLECSQFSLDNKKFISRIKEHTISAIHNKKYLNINT